MRHSISLRSSWPSHHYPPVWFAPLILEISTLIEYISLMQPQQSTLPFLWSLFHSLDRVYRTMMINDITPLTHIWSTDVVLGRCYQCKSLSQFLTQSSSVPPLTTALLFVSGLNGNHTEAGATISTAGWSDIPFKQLVRHSIENQMRITLSTLHRLHSMHQISQALSLKQLPLQDGDKQMLLFYLMVKHLQSQLVM